MSEMTATVTRYLETWNETDPAARRAALEELVTDTTRYVDPMADVTGAAGLDALIAAVQGQFAGLVFSLHGSVDDHHGTARFQWALGPSGAEAIVIGMDVITLDGDGRIQQVLGFLDKVPAGIG